MLEIRIGKRAAKYLAALPQKHARQIALKMHGLRSNPQPPDSKQLRNSDYRRADIGEHRVIYRVEDITLFIPLIGKRKDGDVYRKLDRFES